MQEDPDLLNLSFSLDSSPWTSSFFSYPESKYSSDMFSFQGPDNSLEPNCLYTQQESSFYNPQDMFDSDTFKSEPAEELKPQDLTGVATQDHFPIVISENDNCCVVLESSAMDNNNSKDHFSL